MRHSQKDNANAIISLCSAVNLPADCNAVTTGEWSKISELLISIGKEPADLMRYSPEEWKQLLSRLTFKKPDTVDTKVQQMLKLTARSMSLGFSITDYNNRGISTVTRADPEYPKRLKQRLKQKCPPLFYVAGAKDMLNESGLKAVGIVGSRSIDASDEIFIKDLVNELVRQDYVIVTGGAKGADNTAVQAALSAGGRVVIYSADNMLNMFKKAEYNRAMMQNRLVILSATNPEAGFKEWAAMQRNKFIYAQSDAVVVVKSDVKKGGTWGGAAESLKDNYAPVLCRNISYYAGNQALIKEEGATAVGEAPEGIIAQVIYAQKLYEQNRTAMSAPAAGQGSLLSTIEQNTFSESYANDIKRSAKSESAANSGKLVECAEQTACKTTYERIKKGG